jgi:hypothetical protein
VGHAGYVGAVENPNIQFEENEQQMSQASESSLKSRHRFANILADQKAKRIEFLKDGVRTVPVTDEILERLPSLVKEDDLDEVMGCHPGYKLDGKIKSLERALDSYWRCHADLMARLDAFDVASKDGSLFNRSREAELWEHESACRKEIFALSSAAKVLVELARKVKKIVSQFDEVRAKNFDEGAHTFIIELRNNLSHIMFLGSDWSIKNVGQAQTSHFEFRPAKLLRDGKFNETAKAYLKAQQAPIDVRKLFETYGASVQNFYAWLMPEIEVQLSAEVKDYRRCIRTRRALVRRSGYRLLLTQIMRRDIDLYSYLHEYLTADELQEIDNLPHRSEKQIDRVIEMVDEDGACDGELRSLIYKAFGVLERADQSSMA